MNQVAIIGTTVLNIHKLDKQIATPSHRPSGFIFLISSVFFMLLSPLVYAQAPVTTGTSQTGELPSVVNCAGSQTSYTALTQAAPDNYDIYVRLGQRTQTAPVNVYFQGFTDNVCTPVGGGQVSGAGWAKLGSLALTKETALGTFTLASPTLQSLPNANRPTVMLVSQTHPVCAPTDECRIKINGRDATLRASATQSTGDTLHTVVVKDPSEDIIQDVAYYIDNKPAYTATELKAFDLRYVGMGRHTLATVVSYKSGQQAVISDNVDQGYSGDLNYLFFTYVTSKKSLWLITASPVVFLLSLGLMLAFVRYIYQRRKWRVTHGLSQSLEDKATKSGHYRLYTRILQFEQGKGHVIKRVAQALTGVVLVVVALLFISRWGAQSYVVDGPSMQSTYKSGDQVLVNKLGKTISGLSGKGFIPKRGQVIVFKKESNVSFEPVNTSQPTYLIKRVIGLPGERVVIHKGVITVINQGHPNGFNPDQNAKWAKTMHTTELDEVDVTLQADEVFVCGDNRPESIDSRTYGPVKLHEIVGSQFFTLR